MARKLPGGASEWAIAGVGMAGAVAANILFGDDPTGGYTKRLERMGYTDVKTGVAGNNWVIDYKWPEYPGLTQRKYGNSIRVTDGGELVEAIVRFPGFPEDEHPRSVGEGILEDVKQHADADGEGDRTWINTWAPYFAPHIAINGVAYRTSEKVGERGPKHGDHTMEDAMDLAQYAKERLEREVY